MKMQRWKVIAISLIVAGIASAAWGQAWRPFAFGFGVGGGGASFSGVGDIVSGAIAYWSCGRAYTTAYATALGNACDVFRTSDSTTCTTKFKSTGYVDLTTAYCAGSTQTIVQFCNATACHVSKKYDQSGANACSAAACDMVQATDANRPVYTLSALNGLPCSTWAGSAGQGLATAGSVTQSQPYTVSHVIERTGAFTAQGTDFSTPPIQTLYGTSANTFGMFTGSGVVTATASDSAFHSIQTVFNNAVQDIIYVDGTTNNVNTASAPGITLTLNMGNASGSNLLTGIICELGVWPSAFSAGQLSSVNSNQHSAIGWNF